MITMNSSWMLAVYGGLLIGIAASLMLILNGRIMGISGILGSALKDSFASSNQWRLSFLAGLFLGALALFFFYPSTLENTLTTPYPVLVIAGLLVGYGTRLGNGCTSGHGICGVGRLSLRSIVATLTFLSVGILTASLVWKWKLF